MSPPVLDLATARRLAAQVVEAQGRDFVYNPEGVGNCYYRPLTVKDPLGEDLRDDDPRKQTGCLVGRVLDLHGETRHREQTQPIDELAGAYGNLRDTIEDDALEYLRELQTAQDTGSTWGQALDYAEGQVGRQ